MVSVVDQGVLTRASRALNPDSVPYLAELFATMHDARRWLTEPSPHAEGA